MATQNQTSERWAVTRANLGFSLEVLIYDKKATAQRVRERADDCEDVQFTGIFNIDLESDRHSKVQEVECDPEIANISFIVLNSMVLDASTSWFGDQAEAA